MWHDGQTCRKTSSQTGRYYSCIAVRQRPRSVRGEGPWQVKAVSCPSALARPPASAALWPAAAVALWAAEGSTAIAAVRRGGGRFLCLRILEANSFLKLNSMRSVKQIHALNLNDFLNALCWKGMMCRCRDSCCLSQESLACVSCSFSLPVQGC